MARARKNLINDIKKSGERGNSELHLMYCEEFEAWAKSKGFTVDFPGFYPHVSGHGLEWTIDEFNWDMFYDQPKKYFVEYNQRREEEFQRRKEIERKEAFISTYVTRMIELCKRYGSKWSDRANISIYKDLNGDGAILSDGKMIRGLEIKKAYTKCGYCLSIDTNTLVGHSVHISDYKDYKTIYEVFKAHVEKLHSELIAGIKDSAKNGGWVRLHNDKTICGDCVANNLDIILEHTEAREGKWFADHVWIESEMESNRAESWFCENCEPTSITVGKKTVSIGKTEYRRRGEKHWSMVERFVYTPIYESSKPVTCRSKYANTICGGGGYTAIEDCVFRKYKKVKGQDLKYIEEKYTKKYFSLIGYHKNTFANLMIREEKTRLIAENAPYDSCQL